MSTKKTYTDEQLANLQSWAQLLEKRYESQGGQSGIAIAAKSLGVPVSQQAVNRAIKGHGGGTHVAESLARVAGISVETLLNKPANERLVRAFHDKDSTGAREFKPRVVGTVIERHEDYPNLMRAIEAARALGVHEEILKQAESGRMRSRVDLPFEAWMRWITNLAWEYNNGLEFGSDAETEATLRQMAEGSTGDATLDAMRRASLYDDEEAEKAKK